jgi:hypothetical protein
MIRKLPLLIFPVTLLFAGCEEIMDVQFEGDGKKSIVVEGAITSDTTAHKVVLSWTGDYFKKPPQDMVTGATVSISDGTISYSLQETDSGTYQTDPDVFGEPGKSYTLHVSLPDGRNFSGTDRLKFCTDFDSIAQSDNYNHLGIPGTNNFGYDVLFYGQEPEPIGDNYMFLLYLNDSLVSDTLFKVVFATDEFINGRYIRDLITHIIAEEDFIGDSMKVTLEMQSITLEYYDYLMGLMLETVWRGTPWDGPPANVPSNMNNGARGYFRASDVKRKTRYFYPTPRRETK